MGFKGKDVHVDVALSNVAIAYMPEGMIAELICPVVQVQKQSDAYSIWSQADMFRTEDDKRAAGTEANKITRSISSGTYFADNYALKDNIPYEDIENADAGFLFTTRQSRVEYIKSKLLLNMEYRVALQCTSTSNVGSSTAVASAWTTFTNGNSDPYGDLVTGINVVYDTTGYRPNRILFGEYAWRNWKRHADVIDLIYGNVDKGRSARVVTREQAAALLEIDQVLVGGAYYNTNDEGQSAELSQIWNDNVLIYYAPMKASKDKPSFMYGFRWTKLMNMQAKIYQDEKAGAEEVQLGYYQDEVITAKYLGFLIKGVGSSQ